MGVVIARQVTVRRMHGFGARLGGVLVLVLAGALVGCSEGDPEPKMAPTQSVASTPSGSPSDEPTASPSGHVPLSPREEQRAFLKAYVAAITEAIRTGDVRAFLDLSSPDCQNCQVISQNVSAAYSGGGRIEGGHWELAEAKFDEHDALGDLWNLRVRTAEEKWLDRSGKVTKTITADVVPMAVAVTRAGGGWQVREMRLR